MKFRQLLIAGIFALFANSALAQCTAYGYLSQSGTTVTFYDSSYSAYSHDVMWYFGDGSYGYGTPATHTYTSNGTYYAVLEIYDSLANCSDSTSFTLTISSAFTSTCNAVFSYSVDNANPYKLNFNNTSTNAVSSSWWFGGSNTSTVTSPSHTFATAGYHTVCLTTYDSLTNYCDSVCQSVYVPGATSSGCDATFWASVSGNTVSFYDSTASSSIIEWMFGDGSYGYSSNPTHTYANSGTYTACLYVYDVTFTGDTVLCDSFCQSFTILSSGTSCNATFSYTVDNSNPLKLNFNNTSSNATSAYWWFGNGNSSTQYSPSHTFASAGYYTVCLTTYDSSGNYCDSVCQSVYVPGSSSTSCDATFWTSVSGNTVSFYDSTSSSSVLQWSFGDGTYSSTSSPIHTYSTSGTYTACLYVYDIAITGDTLLCDSFCQSVTIANTSGGCIAGFYASPDSINTSASSYPVYFNNTSTGTNFIWNFGDGSTDTATNPVHTYTSAGTYTACLYVLSGYDSLGLPVVCDSVCQTVTVGGTALSCQASFYLAIDTANIYNLYIVDNSTGTTTGTDYYWTFGDGNSSSVQNPTHQYSSFGLYNLCLTISDSSTGCYSVYCDSIGLDSNGNLLKKDGFGITVIDEDDLVSTTRIDAVQGLSIYPNPTRGQFTIELNTIKAGDVAVDILNSMGQVISTKEYMVNTGANTLAADLSKEKAGIYFAVIKMEDQVKHIKVNLTK
jgi:PKD repeat protein